MSLVVDLTQKWALRALLGGDALENDLKHLAILLAGCVIGEKSEGRGLLLDDDK
jgi:hypothetical protein